MALSFYSRLKKQDEGDEKMCYIDIGKTKFNIVTFNLSPEKEAVKMWTVAIILLSAVAIYSRIALWQHNKSVMNSEEE